jgi:hypothetical protein
MAKSQPFKRSKLQEPASARSLRVVERNWPLDERCRRVDDCVCDIDSDLCGHMVVRDKELDAITRLLGDELEGLLSNISRDRE